MAVATNRLVAPSPASAVNTRIAGGPEAACAARELLTRLLGDTTDEGTLQDALLLTTELVTNAVLHAKVDHSRAVELRVATYTDQLRVSVTDPGAETTPRVRPQDLSVPGGMGLFLVDHISADWGVIRLRDGSRQVWFELAR